ncbi:MAG: hypothetical protein Q8Q00_07385 [Dehalococcoidia bacterium]|nr:hypothetical protein [Dehalococcoidia bacterium]
MTKVAVLGLLMAVFGVSATGILGLLFVEGSGREAASGGICENPGPPPTIALTPADAPPDNILSSLPPNAVQLLAYNPAKGEPQPGLPPGWTWKAGKPERTDGEGAAITNVAADGTTVITLIGNGGLWTWRDPDRPRDVPWYDPAKDLCR